MWSPPQITGSRSLLAWVPLILPIPFVTSLLLKLARGLSSAIYGTTYLFGRYQPNFLAIDIRYPISSHLINLCYPRSIRAGQHSTSLPSVNVYAITAICPHPPFPIIKSRHTTVMYCGQEGLRRHCSITTLSHCPFSDPIPSFFK
jgi:hypothetical protein